MSLTEEQRDKVKEIPEGLIHAEGPPTGDQQPLSEENEEKMVREAEMGSMQEP